MRITDTDAASKHHKDPQKVLSRHESEKKKLYSDACVETHQHFTPLVYSVDGLGGCKTIAAQKRLVASWLAAKWNQEYSEVCGFVRSRLAFTLVCATSRCFCGTCNPHKQSNQLDWAAGAGVRLYHRLF